MLALIVGGLVLVSLLFVGVCAVAFASVAFEPVLVPHDAARFEPSRLKVKPVPIPQAIATKRDRQSQAISA